MVLEELRTLPGLHLAVPRPILKYDSSWRLSRQLAGTYLSFWWLNLQLQSVVQHLAIPMPEKNKQNPQKSDQVPDSLRFSFA